MSDPIIVHLKPGETQTLTIIADGQIIAPAPPVPPVPPVPPTPTPVPPNPRAWDSRLDALGVRLQPYAPKVGEVYWRLVSAQYYPPEHPQAGKAEILCDCIDETGKRLTGIRLEANQGTAGYAVTEAKPGEPFAGGFLMVHAGNAYSVRVSGAASDEVSGMGLWAFHPHVSFGLTFQRTSAVATKAEGRTMDFSHLTADQIAAYASLIGALTAMIVAIIQALKAQKAADRVQSIYNAAARVDSTTDDKTQR